jgi:hypothetical protein
MPRAWGTYRAYQHATAYVLTPRLTAGRAGVLSLGVPGRAGWASQWGMLTRRPRVLGVLEALHGDLPDFGHPLKTAPEAPAALKNLPPAVIFESLSIETPGSSQQAPPARPPSTPSTSRQEKALKKLHIETPSTPRHHAT